MPQEHKQHLGLLKVSKQQYVTFFHQLYQGAASVDMDKICRTLKEVLKTKYASLSHSLKDTLPYVAAEMYSKGLISEAVKDNPTYDSMIREFEAGLQFLQSVPELENHCQLFLKCLSIQGGPVEIAAKTLANDWNEEVNKNCDIFFNLSS